ncbi:immunoglobulin-like domain-containing protein [Dysosmobacter sp.]|uniref:immunoglobulin-like domain-containing protein n=1 Tax=Dysosmobacter sp. TaxID=2591382 RepID=UPI002A8F99BA|nr:immunoglobulin-like domain-containing protein [Dysosmobacter sp.]MDY3282417.1 immunoglobulin-like domain-containing protein [Dysosmobacter sp.]
MKRLFSVLLCVLLLSGCGAAETAPADEGQSGGGTADTLPLTEVRKDRLSGDCVMTTEYPAYGPDVDTVTVLLENRSEEPLETGADFALEADLGKGGELDWFRLEPAGGEELCWFAIAYSVEPGGTLALRCDLSCYDRSAFAGGRFRIVKTVGGKVCTAEFTVSEDAPITADTPYGFAPLEDLPADYTAEAAAADGCVVFAAGEDVENSEAMDTFLAKAALNIPCQVRLARFAAGGTVTVEDVVHEEISGIGCRLAYRRWKNGETEPVRYFSFLNTDGWYIRLSDALVWNDSRGPEPLELLAGDEAEPYMAAVQAWADALAEGNVTRCRVWNPSGTACGGLTEEPLEYSVCTPGEGRTHTLTDVPDTASITALGWEDDRTLVLTVTDADGSVTAVRQVID